MCGINGLAHADDVFCEIHVKRSECKSLTDAQTEHGRHSDDRTQWFQRICDDLLHLFIREGPRLCFHAFAWQREVCETEISARITPGPCRFEKRRKSEQNVLRSFS